MSRFQEIKSAHNYTDADFGPQRIFLTRKAAETAMASGIVQIRPLRPEIELIRDFIDSNTRQKYRFPAEIEDMDVVMRWGGEGAKYRWQWDTQLRKAKPHTRFLHAGDISAAPLSELQQGGAPAGSKTYGEMDPLKTVEVTVKDWENPNLAEDFARGVLFNFSAQRHGMNPIVYGAREFYEAFDPESLLRHSLVQEAGALGRPLNDLLPLAPLTLEDVIPPQSE